MKIVCIGDIHGRQNWKQIVFDNPDADIFVFIGDYFDTHEDISGLEQLNNFEQICKFKRESDKKVVLLIGNHDYHYFPEIEGGNISGFQYNMKVAFSSVLAENRDLLQMAYQQGEFLFTHAGVGETWLKNMGYNDSNFSLDEFINDVWKHKPHMFDFNVGFHRSYSGDDIGQTPIWIRPNSLMKDNSKNLKKQVIQIVGHTYQNQIDIEGKSTGGRYYFIDTLGTSGEYLVIENGKVTVKK